MPRVSRNIGFLLLSQVATVAAAVLTLSLSARYLGVHRFGQQAVLRGMAIFSVSLLAGGLRINMIKEIGRDPERASSYIGNVLTLRWAALVVASVIAGAVVRALPLDRSVELAGYATILLALSGVWEIVPRAIFVAYERNEYNLALSIATGLLGLGLTVAAIRLDLGVAGILLASALASFASGQGALVFVYRRLVRPQLGVDLQRWREILLRSAPLGLSAMLKRSYAQVDVWLLAALQSTAAAGVFSVAYRVTVQVTGSSILIGNAILPRLSLLARTARDQLRAAFERLLLLFLATSVPAAGLLAAFAAPVVTLVVGPQFRDSVEALRLVSIVLVTALPDALLFFLLVALGKEVAATVLLAIGVATNVVLDTLLIPSMGVRGACVGTIAAEWVYLVSTLVQVHFTLGLTSVWQFAGKPIVAGVAMMAAVWLAGPHHPLIGAVSGLSIYAALFLALRALPRGEIRALRRALAPRPATAAAALDPADVPVQE